MRKIGISLVTCALFVAPAVALAGANAGATAYLSWAGRSTSDLPSPGATQIVNVVFDRVTSFKGGEFVIVWTPDTGCTTGSGMDLASYRAPTASKGACTNLNLPGTEGISALEVSRVAGVAHYAWACPTANTSCTSGIGFSLTFDFTSCPNAGGCMGLQAVQVIDDKNEIDTVSIKGDGLTFRGGSAGDCRPGPRGRTWGKIKSIYGRR